MKKNKMDLSKGKRDKLLINEFPFLLEYFQKNSESVEDYQEVFKKTLDPLVCKAFTSYELSRISTEHFRYPSTSRSEMPLFLFDDVALTIKIIKPNEISKEKTKFLSSLPSEVMIGVVGEIPLEIETYTESDKKKDDQFSPEHCLVQNRKVVLKSREIQIFTSGKDVIEFSNPSNQPVVLLVLQSQKSKKILWSYDQKTLKPWQAYSFKQCVSRLELAANYLGESGNQKANDTLKSLENNETHFVRWAAVKAQLKLNIFQGVLALKRVTNDPNPHVQNAAKKTLTQIQKNYPEFL